MKYFTDERFSLTKVNFDENKLNTTKTHRPWNEMRSLLWDIVEIRIVVVAVKSPILTVISPIIRRVHIRISHSIIYSHITLCWYHPFWKFLRKINKFFRFSLIFCVSLTQINSTQNEHKNEQNGCTCRDNKPDIAKRLWWRHFLVFCALPCYVITEHGERHDIRHFPDIPRLIHRLHGEEVANASFHHSQRKHLQLARASRRGDVSG